MHSSLWLTRSCIVLPAARRARSARSPASAEGARLRRWPSRPPRVELVLIARRRRALQRPRRRRPGPSTSRRATSCRRPSGWPTTSASTGSQPADGRPHRARPAARRCSGARERAPRARLRRVAARSSPRSRWARFVAPRRARVLHLLRAHPGARATSSSPGGAARERVPRRAEVLRLHLHRLGLPASSASCTWASCTSTRPAALTFAYGALSRDGDDATRPRCGSSSPSPSPSRSSPRSGRCTPGRRSPTPRRRRPGSIELSALLAKLGSYGLLRFAVGLLPLALVTCARAS